VTQKARANLKKDFDKDTVVDLLCNRIDELEGALREAIELADYCGKVYVDYNPGTLERLWAVLTPKTNTKEE
jgi:hypothetical protein